MPQGCGCPTHLHGQLQCSEAQGNDISLGWGGTCRPKWLSWLFLDQAVGYSTSISSDGQGCQSCSPPHGEPSRDGSWRFSPRRSAHGWSTASASMSWEWRRRPQLRSKGCLGHHLAGQEYHSPVHVSAGCGWRPGHPMMNRDYQRQPRGTCNCHQLGPRGLGCRNPCSRSYQSLVDFWWPRVFRPRLRRHDESSICQLKSGPLLSIHLG